MHEDDGVGVCVASTFPLFTIAEKLQEWLGFVPLACLFYGSIWFPRVKNWIKNDNRLQKQYADTAALNHTTCTFLSSHAAINNIPYACYCSIIVP